MRKDTIINTYAISARAMRGELWRAREIISYAARARAGGAATTECADTEYHI